MKFTESKARKFQLRLILTSLLLLASARCVKKLVEMDTEGLANTSPKIRKRKQKETPTQEFFKTDTSLKLLKEVELEEFL